MRKNNNYLDISERKILLRIVDVFVLISGLFLGFHFFKTEYIYFNSEEVTKWLLILVIYFLLFGEIFQLYNLNISNNKFQTVRSVIIATLSTTLFYILTPYITPSLPVNRLQILYFFFLITIPLVIWRLLYATLFFSKTLYKSIVLVGHSSKMEYLLKTTKNKGFHKIAAYISDKKIEGFDNYININDIVLENILIEKSVNEMIISTKGFSEEITNQLKLQLIHLFEEAVNIKSFESFYEEITFSVPKEYLTNDFYKYINFSTNSDNRLYLFFHRALDILFSSIGIVFFIILIPIIFIGNLIGNRGAFFYTQERVGKGGKPFEILKLRTMVPTINDGPVWATKNDHRITSFGRFLRKTRIDEVPQFYNILKGDMSLIGPRPEQSFFISSLEEKIPFYSIRNVIRPGLTGWAQVNFPYAASIEEQEKKLRYDIYYIKERSLFLDFKILIKTISTVLFMKGQ
ncbi:hypothetical protein LPB136_04605 [Tenacibaculum todarodis]|uniref:Bacterial sugar transferase domain-containing protein n=1 Tax=Tenacibaculum todarodis TaxID=1850252 RepID=A0A1L3JHR6_9FLAO|nr:exopolysaccharide biosynthesis polyprenyl glycosylphosphotransferase [Tenacibaculum todarodis]APG64685.1 hypothetical protein LPB136_04605 [Tenacibaculum todarodis]